MTLKAEKLSKKFGDSWALRDVSFDAGPGEVLGIYGPSGVGKSTLLRLLSGSDTPSAGAIFHRGTEVTKLACDERNFHFPTLSNQSIWKALFKTGKASQLADGVGQGLAIDRALESVTNVLLLDNSFCDMDKHMRFAKFARVRKAVKDKGLSVVYASNDFDDVFELCDRVAVLLGGEIVQIGTPQEVYEYPVSAAVARTVGRNNLFTARRLSSSKADMPEFQTIAGEHRLFTHKVPLSSLGPINQDATLAIRPENISISFGASFPDDNLLKATIAYVKPRGATTLVGLDSNGLMLDALVLRLVGLNVGDECMVGLPPDRIQILT
jgi:ABC-type Fe3+/spermidine/putrescine transport system ATPase subunit